MSLDKTNNTHKTSKVKMPRIKASDRRCSAHRGISLIRLLHDLSGAAYEPVFRAGDTVEAKWMQADAQWPAGWQVIGCGFFVRLSNDDVGIVER